MEFEVLKRNNIKRNVIIVLFIIIIISAVILNYTLAKYRVTDSVPIINSEINYKVPDLNMVSLYIANEEGTYIEADTIPESGYALNKEQSYCGISNNGEIIKDDIVNIVYENGQVNVLGLTKKGTKCYLYFDENTPSYTMTEIIASYNEGNRENFSRPYTSTTTNTVYTTTDWKGTSYYFAGAPTDNWVQFGGFYWRIVRVNGDGSIRLIYNGTSTTTTGTGTLINNGSAQAFNSEYNRSEYVGLKYTSGEQHGQTTNSSILNTLQAWYNSSNLDDYANYIDNTIGFCSDRNMERGSNWSSQPSGEMYYAAWERLYMNKNPSLACSSNDIIKEPVGLITADEVAFAGGVLVIANQSYYLYNNQYYWTMTPDYYNGSEAGVMVMLENGSIGDNGGNVNWDKYNNSDVGIRPVINLKANTKFTGNGTVDSPFEVV